MAMKALSSNARVGKLVEDRMIRLIYSRGSSVEEDTLAMRRVIDGVRIWKFGLRCLYEISTLAGRSVF